MFVTDVKSPSSVKFVVMIVFFYGSVGSRISKWDRRSSILCITHSGEGNVQIDVYGIVITGGHHFPKSSWSVHSNIFSVHDLMLFCAKKPPLGGHRL